MYILKAKGYPKPQTRIFIDSGQIVAVKKLINLVNDLGYRFFDPDGSDSDLQKDLNRLDTKLCIAVSTYVARGIMKPHTACSFINKDEFCDGTFKEYEKNKQAARPGDNNEN